MHYTPTHRFTISRIAATAAIASMLLTATPASACQLVCMATTAKYDGATVGGISGGDAKCAAEFTGFKFARSTSIVANLASSYTASPLVSRGNIWAASWPGGDATTNCTNWTSSSASGQSGPILTLNSGYVTQSSQTCNYSYPLLCCNM